MYLSCCCNIFRDSGALQQSLQSLQKDLQGYWPVLASSRGSHYERDAELYLAQISHSLWLKTTALP
jgi:hypothetical protein